MKPQLLLSFIGVLVSAVLGSIETTGSHSYTTSDVGVECDASGNCADAVNDRHIVKLVDQKSLNRNMNVAFVMEGLMEPFASRAQVMHTYTDALPGFLVHGLSQLDVVRLKNDARVEYIVPDTFMTLAATQFDAVWNLDRLDQNSSVLDKQYTYFSSGVNVDVYVLDSGIMEDHDDFLDRNGKSRVTNAFNAVPFEGNGDDIGHGTSVAAVIGGKIYGVSKSVRLFNVKVVGSSSDVFPTSNIIAGINFVINEKKKNPTKPTIINLSMSGTPSIALQDAVTSAINNGIFVSAAAGNGGNNACDFHPGSIPNVVSVAASQIGDYFANFSNTGDCVDIYAPGLDILTASLECGTCNTLVSGTSVAAAHVSGIAAQIMEQFPTEKPATIWERMYNSSMIDTLSNYIPYKMKESKKKPVLRTKRNF